MKQTLSPKLIVTDLDGTALRDDKTISNATVQAFLACQKRGIYTAIATARYHTEIAPISNLKPDFQILTDGTLIYEGNSLLYSATLDTDTTNNILMELSRRGFMQNIALPTIDKIYHYNRHKPYNPSVPFPFPVNKVVAVMPSSKDAEQIAALYHVKQLHYRGEPRYTFFSPSAGKLNAIRRIAERLQITLDDVLTFGDDINDMEMIEKCGVGVAMGNALPEVQAVADYVTTSNEEDGIFRFLQATILTDMPAMHS